MRSPMWSRPSRPRPGSRKACRIGRARWRRCTSRAFPATWRRAAGAWPSRSCCSRSSCSCAGAPRVGRAAALRCSRPGGARRALAAGGAAVRAHGRSAQGGRGDRRGSRRAAPMQRLLMGEVGSGKTVVALYAMLQAGRARPPGRADGAHGDARRAALRDDPAPAGRRGGWGSHQSALLTGSTPAAGGATSSASSPAASCR